VGAVDAGQTAPLVVVDRLEYDTMAPWPATTAGLGDSLNRVSDDAFGATAIDWIASPPTPGSVNFTVRVIGDSNDDGKFDQADVRQVLQAGKYKTGQAATWADGDWTGDGLFDQLDIVAVLRSGNYLAGAAAARSPEATESSTPELIDEVLAAQWDHLRAI
jgi:hypothetical protein